MTRPFLVAENEEGEDTCDADPANVMIRAGYLHGLSLKYEPGHSDRLILQRAARSLVLFAQKATDKRSDATEMPSDAAPRGERRESPPPASAKAGSNEAKPFPDPSLDGTSIKPAEVVCTCLLVDAWEDPCPRHGAIPGTVAARNEEERRSKATPMTGAEGDVPFESYEAAQRDPNEKRCRMVHLNDWTSSPDAFRCEDEKGHPGLCTFDRWDFRARIATPLFGKPISGACQEDKCPMRGWHHTHEPAQRGRPEASTLDEVAKLNARLVVAQDIILSLVRWTNSGDCPDCHPFRPAPSYPDWQHEEGCEHLADINRGLVFLGKQPQEGHALPDAKAEMQRLAQERRESPPPASAKAGSNDAKPACPHRTWLERSPPECADCGFVDRDGTAYEPGRSKATPR